MKEVGTFKIFELSAYVVKSNSDRNDGSGQTTILGYFEKLTDAQQVAKGNGVFGCDADVSTSLIKVCVPTRVDITPNVAIVEDWSKAFVIDFDKNIRYQKDWIDPKIARESALAKLTHEEQVMLGLTPGSIVVV